MDAQFARYLSPRSSTDNPRAQANDSTDRSKVSGTRRGAKAQAVEHTQNKPHSVSPLQMICVVVERLHSLPHIASKTNK